MNILISGASIAGPALAFWLARQGHRVTVVERAPALRPGGYAVDIRGTALEVVRRMGLREAIRPLETDTLSTSVVDARGRRFGRTERGFGVIDAGDVEIHRGDLARLLFEATRGLASYRFGDSVSALDADPTGVNVCFEHAPSARYDLVVGADGVHSRIRALAFGAEERLVRELGSCMAIFTVPNHLGLEREQLLFNGERRIASIKSASGNRELKVCVFFTPALSGFRSGDLPLQRELVARAFADQGWEFPRLVEAMWSAEDFYGDVTCQVRLESLCSGRVVLVGDAGYCPSPLTGQGTSLALVGAYLLGAALEAAPDVPAALARYDAQMGPFARRNQDVALEVAGGFAPTTPFQVRARNFAMRVLPHLPGSGLMMKLAMRGIRQAAHALVVPEAGPRAPAASNLLFSTAGTAHAGESWGEDTASEVRHEAAATNAG